MRPLAPKPLGDAAVAFRTELLDLLDRCTPLERFFYIDAGTVVVVCPICDGALTIRFAGRAARADLECQRGCGEKAVLDALRGSR